MRLSMLSLVALATATPTAYNSRPYAHVAKRQASYGGSSGADNQVDLGYSIYQGYSNTTAGLDIYKGIRFAEAPIGNLRFQAPRAPAKNRSSVMDASSYAPTCPQNPSAGIELQAANQTGASEDCLFLNVWTPSNATEQLPVYVWIHGGGYGQGNGRQDMTAIMGTNDNAFIGVSIQYRLGAFGFLSSDEVFRKGSVNAALLDQHLALQWVQQYIHLFNGDPTRVTISGESAGGGSVMLQDMAYGGSLGTQLFQNSIVESPYLPMQYGYKDWVPSQSYYAFAVQAGCAPNGLKPAGKNKTTPIFECLVAQDSETLINASATVSQEGPYGTWAFLPVTDGVFIQDVPSRQLTRGRVNGLNMLSGNNANEGVAFTPQDISTEEDLVAYLHNLFPLFSDNDVAKLLFYYPIPETSTSSTGTQYATSGDSGPTALYQSSVGTGQQQRADNIYAETTFVCPAYWLAEAYSGNTRNSATPGQSWKYQFSIPPAYHGADVAGYYNYPGQFYSVDFITAFQKIFGNFVVHSDPAISDAVANGVTQMGGNVSANGASVWPAYSVANPTQLDLNTTCPVVTGGTACNGSEAVNTFRLVDAYSWEGGRGTRCDFFKSVAELVPE